MKPDEIQAESFRIIDAEVGPHGFDAAEWPVVRRVIHAAGDLDLAGAVCFRRDAVREGVRALRQGAPIITDVRMVAAGLNRRAIEALKLDLHCFIDDPEVAEQAEARGLTRSHCAMQKAVAHFPEAVFVVGNAPTALLALCEAVRRGTARPPLLVAMPVGFVGVLESKEQALALDVPVIAVAGRKGGSALAAAAVNALLLMAAEGGPA